MQPLFQFAVQDAMTTDIVTIDLAHDVHKALDLMSENHVAAIPVVDNQNRCVGMLSASDIVEFARETDHELGEFEGSGVLSWGAYLQHLGNAADNRPVSELMTKEVASIAASASLATAASTMLRGKVHRLPVVDDTGKLQGVVSTTDILRVFVHYSEVDSEQQAE